MENECHVRFKQEWDDYPSQDNEGYQPDRGGFKAGFFSAWNIREEKFKVVLQSNIDFSIEVGRLLEKISDLSKLTRFMVALEIADGAMTQWGYFKEPHELYKAYLAQDK